MTQSLERLSLSWTLVIERFSTRVVRYSSLMVMLFCNVTSIPNSGENCSLMLTVEMLYMLEGVSEPSVALTNPKSPMYSSHEL